MSARGRIKEVLKALGPDEWLSAKQISLRIPERSPSFVISTVTIMAAAGRLERRGERGLYEYRVKAV